MVTFVPELFGTSVSTFNVGGCTPTQASAGGDWTLSASLGQCGMTVGAANFDPNGTGAQEYITFDVPIRAGAIFLNSIS